MRLLLHRFMFWLGMKTRIYVIWSHIYQWIWERKYSKLNLPFVNSMTELVNILKQMVWREDGPKELWDVISSPQAVWGRFKNRESVGDCDDFASFNTNTILEAQKLNKFPEISDVFIMSVMWDTGQWSVRGHSVALLVGTDGKFGILDYDYPDWFNSADEGKQFILKKYGNNAICTGWSILDCQTLVPLHFGTE